MQSLKKIVVTGPESTGKSTLCGSLAQHFGTLWVPEYAREYLEKNGGEYTYDDLKSIARGQLDLEDQYAAKARQMGHAYLFIDTDMYVMKVWSEYVFGKCDDFILNSIATRKYDMYLLATPDLPWEYDNLREQPGIQAREEIFSMYKDALMHQHTPWAQVSGNGAARLQMAVDAVSCCLM